MLSHDWDSLAQALAAAAHNGGLSPSRCWELSALAAHYAQETRRLESVAVPQPARLADDALPANVVRFETEGAIHSRRNVLACALWPALAMGLPALAVLAGVGL